VSPRPKRWAFLVHPHLGGTWTVFAALRQGLAAHGIELRWVGLGEAAAAARADPAWAPERERGEAIHLPGAGEAEAGMATARHLAAAGYEGVFVNVLACPVQTNAVRYLPAGLRRIMLVHSITPGTYAAARAMRRHVHATVGVSERIQDDLVRRHGFAPALTRAIPNAVDLARFLAEQHQARAPGTPWRLLSLGRIEETAKGLFWLPPILAGLDGLPWRLTVAGDGPDRAELRHRLASFGNRVAFTGPMAPAAVPALLARHDLFLMPSRFEGFGQTLVEAMAAGCVPVASRLHGVTDRIVAHGEDGLLFPVGDVAAAAAGIRALLAAPERHGRMAALARERVQGRFDLERQAAAYAALVEAVAAMPEHAVAVAAGRWSCPRGLRPGLRTRLPEPVKRLLRTWRERLRRPLAERAHTT
jgi:glycosyltransferase involved in cell wall biosynthesis